MSEMADRKLRVLASSDWHIDASTAGLERLGEVRAHADHLEAVVREQRVDLFLHLGDVFDPGHLRESHYHAELLRMAAGLNGAATHGSVWLAGNHDVLDEGSPLTTLSPLAAVSRHWVNHTHNRLDVAELPACYTRGPVAILCMPYVSRAAMGTPAFRRAWADAFEVASAYAGGRLVVLSHLSLPNMHPGSEQEMPRGREVDFPVEQVLELKPAVVLQGHYHARQVVRVRGLEVQVVGAPVRFTFGERADGERGYLLVEV